MKNDDKPMANPFVVLREEFDDWAVLFNPDTGRGFGLNPTGVYLWKLLDGEHALNALLEESRDHGEDVPDEAGDHIGAFVDALVGQGLAGFNSTESGLLENANKEKLRPKKCSFSPCEEVNEVKTFNYEPPQLVDLGGRQAAHGVCYNGSHDSGDCAPGLSASGTWCSTGTTPASICGYGSSPPGQCCSGDYATTNRCSSGLNATYGWCQNGTNPYTGHCSTGTGVG